MIGKTVGNYRIVRELGVGGMGAVYQGVDVMVERPVAIKMLRAEIARQPELIERFRSEAVTLARLNHPCIATLYAFFREAEEYFMVMEFVPGRTLEAILKESGPMPCERAALILRQTLEGMAHAHSMGVLHRDIKPANVMLTDGDKVKVTDFGIARVLGSSRMTREGRIIGTLEYIAPERIKGEEADVRSDLYSAGVLLYEAITGRLPFVSDTDYGLMQAHLNQAPPPISTVGIDCPPELEAVIQCAMAKDPNDRFQSAEAFYNALSAAAPCIETLYAPTRTMANIPASMPTRLATSDAGVKPTRLAGTETLQSPAPPARKLPIKWIALGAVLMFVAVAVATWWVMRPKPQTTVNTPPPPPQVQTPAAVTPAASQLPDAVKQALEQDQNKSSIIKSGAEVPLPPAPPAAKKKAPSDGDDAARKAAEARRKEALRALER